MTSTPSHEPPGYACPFCAVVRGDDNEPFTVQDDVVDRTEATTVFIASRWWKRNPGHVIVVPNEHVENMYVLPRDLAGELHETARRIALALKEAYGCDGISTRQHNEPGGNQEVWHYHLHRLPALRGRRPLRRNVAEYDTRRAPSVCRETTPRAGGSRVTARLVCASVPGTDFRQEGIVSIACQSLHTLVRARRTGTSSSRSHPSEIPLPRHDPSRDPT